MSRGIPVQASRSVPPLITAFGRSQVAAFIASVLDFGLLVILVEFFGFWYVLATAIGATAGAATNFLLGRYWCFQATHRPAPGQAWRYAMVSGGSLLLNSLGVFAFTDGLGFQYALSKVWISILVGVLYNFPLQRRFVFG